MAGEGKGSRRAVRNPLGRAVEPMQGPPGGAWTSKPFRSRRASRRLLVSETALDRPHPRNNSSRRLAVKCPHENRHLQREQHRRAAAGAAPLALQSKPDVACLQELKGAGREIPRSTPSARRATRPSGTARRPGTASPSSPGARSRRRPAAACPATRTTPTAATSRPSWAASPSAASTCPTATPPRARSSTTS